MHIPDGFIDGATSAAAAVAAAGGTGAALRRAAARVQDRLVPFAGLTAAFVFALQMLNFPVGAGTSGHLLGGALAAVLLGPWLGAVALSVVVAVQALLFADGGLSALGLNVLNLALVTVAVAWPVFRLARRLLPIRAWSVVVASMFAAWASVVASALAFSLEYAAGGMGGVDPAVVLTAMVGVHSLIGIGEGLITGAVVAAVLAARPDLLAAAGTTLPSHGRASPPRSAVAVLVATGVGVAVALVVLVAPFASPEPDGLEAVAARTGFAEEADPSLLQGPLADYGVEGVESPLLATALAGLAGVGVTFAAGMLLAGVVRRRRSATAR